MLSDFLIEPESLVALPDGLELGLRLPWYQSMPLSTVRLAALSVDGQPIALDQIRFTLDGRTRPLAAMADLTGEFWFVTDTMRLALPFPAAQRGSAHDIALRLCLFPPYAESLRRDNAGQLRMRAA